MSCALAHPSHLAFSQTALPPAGARIAVTVSLSNTVTRLAVKLVRAAAMIKSDASISTEYDVERMHGPAHLQAKALLGDPTDTLLLIHVASSEQNAKDAEMKVQSLNNHVCCLRPRVLHVHEHLPPLAPL